MRTMRHQIYKLKRGIRNLIRYFGVIWNDEDFDYNYLLDIMKKKIGYMEKFFLNDDKTFTKNAPKYGKELKVARILLERIHEDNYSEPYFKVGDQMNKFRHYDKLKRQDIDYLFKLMSKKIQCWWD